MKKITVVVAMMCALSAYVSYPSATVSGAGEALSPLAMSMQESRSLPVEAYDACLIRMTLQGATPDTASRLLRLQAYPNSAR